MADQISSSPSSGEDPWLTVAQVSDELKLNPSTVRIWIRTGRLAAVNVGRSWRIRRSDLERALLRDASPALAQEELPVSEPSAARSPTPAPRRMADHLLTVTPAVGRRS